MDFLHCKMNLVHMDLKPANVLLDANFNAKVIYALIIHLYILVNELLASKSRLYHVKMKSLEAAWPSRGGAGADWQLVRTNQRRLTKRFGSRGP